MRRDVAEPLDAGGPVGGVGVEGGGHGASVAARSILPTSCVGVTCERPTRSFLLRIRQSSKIYEDMFRESFRIRTCPCTLSSAFTCCHGHDSDGAESEGLGEMLPRILGGDEVSVVCGKHPLILGCRRESLGSYPLLLDPGGVNLTEKEGPTVH